MPFAHVAEIDAIFTDNKLAPEVTRLVEMNNVELHITNGGDGRE
jgi:DeoR/GlpR family transcriptional regulator of sugar metabolism